MAKTEAIEVTKLPTTPDVANPVGPTSRQQHQVANRPTQSLVVDFFRWVQISLSVGGSAVARSHESGDLPNPREKHPCGHRGGVTTGMSVM